MTRILKLILGCPFWLLGVGIGAITFLARVAMDAIKAGVEWLGRPDLYVDGVAALAQVHGSTPACSACGSTAFRCIQCDSDDAECYDSLAGAEGCDLAGNEY